MWGLTWQNLGREASGTGQRGEEDVCLNDVAPE